MAERLNKDSFQEKVLNASGLAIADFYSDSCIPCKKLSPILADLDEKYPDVYIGKVNIVYEQGTISDNLPETCISLFRSFASQN